MQPKVYVQKLGQVHTVYVNLGTNQALPVASWDDKPPGGFPYTANSRREIEQKFPGHELVILEAPVKPANIITRSKEIKDEATRVMGDMQLAEKELVDAKIKTPTIAAVKREVEASMKATEFLKRIKFAMQYASEENLAILGIQADIIEELIEEVFEK